MPPVFVEHPISLEHETGGHPEQPARITAITSELERHGWLGLRRVRSEPVDLEVLRTVHPDAYIARIERVSAGGGGYLDADTVVSARSYEAARHGAGGATGLVDLLLAGEAPYGFSAHRPPGHHATRDRAMGFCLFNNVAVAAQHALDAGGLQRVLILDWDVHHGNGTNDIFHRSDQALFISIHQSPLYPGTGGSRDVGSGTGTGYTVNLPVAPGSGDAVFVSLVEHVAVPLLLSFEPELVLISAGFDAHLEDPLADCRVTEAGYGAMALAVWRAAREVGAPLGMVLEGGYALGALARSVVAVLAALGEESGGGAAAIAPDALDARRRLAKWWPELADV
jgi:acetoin utilization deacetylase AcuC-like enzyme